MYIVSTQWGEESKQAQKLQTELMQENGGEFQLSPKSYARGMCSVHGPSVKCKGMDCAGASTKVSNL